MNSREFSSLIKRIRHATEQVAPASVWVDKTKVRLVKQVECDLARQHHYSWSEKTVLFVQSFLPVRFVNAVRGPMLATLSVLTIVTGGSIASVSASERSIPGDFLYPLKLAHEQASILFAKSSTDRLRLKTEYVGRRVDEIKAIVATPNAPDKDERIKQAAETLKRDFDTVKVQLTEVKQDSQPRDVAEAAKLLDQKTTDAAHQLNDVKQDVTPDVRIKVAEVQAAALNTSVKAVQAMIETKDQPNVQDVVTSADIAQSLQNKVQGIEDNVNDSEQKLAGATSTISLTTSTTVDMVHVSSSAEQIQNVKLVLDQTKQFVVENKFDQAQTSLDQATKAAATLDASVASLDALAPAASSTPTVLPSGSTTSSGMNASTTNQGTSSTVASVASSTSSTTSTSTKP